MSAAVDRGEPPVGSGILLAGVLGTPVVIPVGETVPLVSGDVLSISILCTSRNGTLASPPTHRSWSLIGS